MPKIQLVSDLHLDISGHLSLPGGDVLIIAGDACESKTLRKEFHGTRVLPYPGNALPCYDFFTFECKKYKKVFYVLGNHEHYRGTLHKTKRELEKMMPENVTILEDQVEVYDGVVFVGSTLWTDMNKNNPITISDISYSMNDYRKITFRTPDGVYRHLTPADTVYIHNRSRKYIEAAVQQYLNMPVVVITHMGPTFSSIDEKYRNEYHTNGAYCSDLSDLILDNPNIKYWVHGHTHSVKDYMVGDTRVLCNPRGYLPYEDTQFNPNLVFEIQV